MLPGFRRLMSSEYSLVFCLSLCLIFGISYVEWIYFDVNKWVDPKTYWGLAHFDFAQSPIRKYRVLEPFLVAGIHWIVTSVVHLFNPHAMTGDLPLARTFYLFNLTASAMFCTLSYAYVRSLKCSRLASLAAVFIIANTWWTINNTAWYVVDALYNAFIALTLLGITRRNGKMIFWSMVLAPFVKEAYMFMLPLIFFFSHVPKLRLLAWAALSGTLVFGYRYLYDHLTGHPMQESLSADGEHFTFILTNAERFLDRGYRNLLIAAIGLWPLVPLGGMVLIPGFAARLLRATRLHMVAWLLLVLLQMLMSGDLSRMFCMWFPVYAFFIAFTVDAWRKHINVASSAPALPKGERDHL